MKTTWVLVAESGRARIFAWSPRTGRLSEMLDLVHPRSRHHPRDITTDLPGRSFDSLGGARHAMEPATDPKRHEAETFAREIAGHLERAGGQQRYEELVLIAPPRFLGLLREHLGDAARTRVSREIHKNLARADADAVRQAISEEP